MLTVDFPKSPFNVCIAGQHKMMPCVSKEQTQHSLLMEALRGTKQLNPGLKMPHRRPATAMLPNGEEIKLTTREARIQLYFKCRGCTEGLQHYKRCQPASILIDADLLCPFCVGNTVEWCEAGRAKLIDAEHTFMQLLLSMAVSRLWCHQVYHSCWHGRFDFYEWQQNVLVQIDDKSHWQQCCSDAVVVRDLCCNIAVYCATEALVRVHVFDLDRPDIVFAAVSAAAAHRAVVFTTGFNTIGFWHILNLLVCLGSQCIAHCDMYGNTIIRHCV